MTKLNLILTSLVAAIPAGLLAYLIVSVFLNFGLKGTMMTVLAGGTLATAVIVAVLPIGIAIFQPKHALAAAGPASPAESAADFDTESGEYDEFDGDADAVSGEFEQEDLSVFDEEPGTEFGDPGTVDDDFDFEEFLEDDQK